MGGPLPAHLLVDALEDVVVQVPGLVQLRLLARLLILEAPLVGLVQLAAIGLGRGVGWGGGREFRAGQWNRLEQSKLAFLQTFPAAPAPAPSLHASTTTTSGLPDQAWRMQPSAMAAAAPGHQPACSGPRPTCTKAISLSVVGPCLRIISCSGSSVDSMPSTLLSPKYSRLASSSASCHISCHRMAMRISSWLTSCACSTRVALCWRTASTTAMAAARRDGLWLLHATSSGYMRAWGEPGGRVAGLPDAIKSGGAGWGSSETVARGRAAMRGVCSSRPHHLPRPAFSPVGGAARCAPAASG